MWKKKLVAQTLACLLIAGTYGIISVSDSAYINEKRDSVTAAIYVHYTISDITEIGKQAVVSLIHAPSVVTNKIIASNETRKYGLPVDNIPAGETGPVYAAAGGKVIETGENDDLGLYIKIKHEDKLSVYGNCDRLYAQENEHVRKGQIIASFTNDGTGEFIYEMIENNR